MAEILAIVNSIYLPSINNPAQVILCKQAPDPTTEEHCDRLNSAFKDRHRAITLTLHLEGKEPILYTPEEANSVRAALRADPAWRHAFSEFLHLKERGHKDSEFEQYVAAIMDSNRPWWIRSGIYSLEDQVFNPTTGRLHLNFRGDSHSYCTQLGQHGLSKSDSASVAGVVLIEDGTKYVVGFRAGHNLPETEMAVPAGSVDVSSENPLFDTYFKELREELGIDAEHATNTSLIASGHDVQVSRNTHFVFRTILGMSEDELQKAWEKTDPKHKGEHHEIRVYPNTLEGTLDHLKRLTYVPSQGRNQKNVILPQAGMSLLAHQIQGLSASQECPGRQMLVERVHRELEGRYVFS